MQIISWLLTISIFGHRLWTHDRNLSGYVACACAAGDDGQPRMGQIGQGYLKSLFALGFQAVLMIICVAIYAVLVRSIAVETDVVKAIWTAVGYTVLLCFCLFKTSSLSRSILGAH